MELRKNLYHIRFATHNPLLAIQKGMRMAFPKLGPDKAWVKLDKYTYLVYTTQDYQSIRLMIGCNLADDIDDFVMMQLDYDTAMSTFTDRLDVIEFLKAVKQDCIQKEEKPTEADINRILDKMSLQGADSLSMSERKALQTY